MEQVKWIDINWSFYFDTNFMPLLISRLEGTAARMKEFSKDTTDEQLKQQPASGWSIKQHIGHLSFVELIHASRLDDFKNKAAQLRGIDLSNEKQMMEDYNNADLQSIIQEFETRRKKLIKQFKSFSDEELKNICIHPRYNRPFRTIDYAYSSSTHDDYHLAKVLALIK
jgi:hypothetical protein